MHQKRCERFSDARRDRNRIEAAAKTMTKHVNVSEIRIVCTISGQIALGRAQSTDGFTSVNGRAHSPLRQTLQFDAPPRITQ